MPLHLVGIGGDRIWHTIRNPAGWDPWQDVTSVAGSLGGTPSRVACGLAGGQLHVLVDTDRSLYHTIRFGPGNWQPWGDAGAAAFPGVRISNVDCVGIGDELHVCVEGFTISGSLRSLPAVSHAIRTSNPNPSLESWSSTGEITARYKVILDLACGTAAANLHVLARCDDVGGKKLLIHTVRFPDGNLQAARDQDVIGVYPATASALRQIGRVAAAGIDAQLHVVGSDGAELFHTIRLNDTNWQNSFGPVRRAVDTSFTRALGNPACASADGNLHVCALSSGRIWHTIRLSNPPAWRNPENATRGRFGDVLTAVQPGPDGAPAGGVIDIACAGA